MKREKRKKRFEGVRMRGGRVKKKRKQVEEKEFRGGGTRVVKKSFSSGVTEKGEEKKKRVSEGKARKNRRLGGKRGRLLSEKTRESIRWGPLAFKEKNVEKRRSGKWRVRNRMTTGESRL